MKKRLAHSIHPVSLVGAGPGDPGLITVAGLERLRVAEVVVYDRLVAPSLPANAQPDVELIYVGKIAGDSHDQNTINRLLIDKAREGKRVVRLKGGDPFVFGRGGEEAQALRAAGVPFEIVPGVTSAVAVPAYAGIPITHRGVASTFAVITGHEDPTKDETAIDWKKMATAVDTLVFLMGTKTLAETTERLIANGRSRETPVAVIRWGTTPEQQTVVGTIADIASRVDAAGLRPPTIAVVGEVVRLRETLAWYENRPLFGKRVLITRTRKQASVLARLLAAEGAIPIELPAIEIEPTADPAAVDAALTDLTAGRYAWGVFTSANAVDLWFRQMREHGLDARAFAATKIAAIGPVTAQALNDHGISADLVPDEYVAEALASALSSKRSIIGTRVLLPRAEDARPELVDGLRTVGAEVDEVALYRAAVPQTSPAEALSLLRGGAIDVVTFTSSSTVRNLAVMLNGDLSALAPSLVILSADHAPAQKRASSRRNLGSEAATARGMDPPRGPLIACIGPITAATAEEVLGRKPDVVAEEYTVEGLVRAVWEHVSANGGVDV